MMRPQDKWNLENGYISKSYKVHLNLAKDFAELCTLSHETQAHALAEFMKNFCLSTKRRIYMLHFESSSINKNILQNMYNQFEIALSKISSKDIENKEVLLLKEKKAGNKIRNDKVAYYKLFRVEESPLEYLKNPVGVINYLHDLVLTEFALYQLMRKGRLMPIGNRPPLKIEINIQQNFGGNMIFQVFIGLMPFEEFIILPSNDR